MKLSVFNAHAYDKKYIGAAHAARESLSDIEISFHEFPLSLETVPLATGADAVCAFVNDDLSAPVLTCLHKAGIQAILMRCAGYNNVDLDKAKELGLFVANVPSYSPEAVAEFALALIQTLNRNTHRAYNRVREGNFNLDGLLGKTLCGKTAGLVGTGRIGIALARILHGFGCIIVAYDPFPNADFEKYGSYTDLDTLLSSSDIVSLHCPLMPQTKYIINEQSISKMKRGAMLVNTSRGALIDTRSVIRALKSKQLGGLALDVYEGEGKIFYRDHSTTNFIIDDDVLMRLLTFPNVIISGHQAFFTEEALGEIADVTLNNLEHFRDGKECPNSLIGDTPLRRGLFPVRTI